MKQWIKSIFYTPQHTKPTDDNILRLLAPSFVGIILCMICLSGCTWAWFSASVCTSPQTIAAAEYDIDVIATDAAGEPVDLTEPLTANTEYKIVLSATGTAEKFGGYCLIKGGERPLYTEQIYPGAEPFTFTLIPKSTAEYTFTAVWGNRGENAPIDIVGDAVVGQKQPGAPEPFATPTE